MRLPFSKYSGSGNDFVMVDNREKHFPDKDPASIARLCNRRTGIGADGLILLERSAVADMKMRIFNADGSEAEMCGNGIRCLLKFAHEIGIPRSPCSCETLAGIVTLTLDGELVTAEMQDPTQCQFAMKLQLDGETVTLDFLNTGVPHAVLFVEELEQERWMAIAPSLRRHPAFGAAGSNVNFVKREGSRLHIRTYERGVEGETLACGTGTAAAALAAAHNFRLPSPIRVIPRSGESIYIHFDNRCDRFTALKMSGPATRVFNGWVDLN